jgi:hypothetical protein
VDLAKEEELSVLDTEQVLIEIEAVCLFQSTESDILASFSHDKDRPTLKDGKSRKLKWQTQSVATRTLGWIHGQKSDA